MKVCLAGTGGLDANFYTQIVEEYKVNILESFAYMTPLVEKLIPKMNFFVLDSGAFTFMNCKKNKIPNMEEYIEKYCDFINKNNIQNFMEIDIDSVIGYEEVKKITKKIEKKTNRQVIPVFHKNRGIEEYKRLIQEYKYIAIGTIRDYSKNPMVLYELVKLANKNNCKVHGLGYTIFDNLKKIKFYSVDSTTWNSAGRFGELHVFNGEKILKYRGIRTEQKKQKLINVKKCTQQNFIEWLKYQQYAEMYL